MNQVDLDQILTAIEEDNFKLVESLAIKYQLTDVSEIRDHESDKMFELLAKEKYALHRWNALLLAIKSKSLKSVKFFAKELKMNFPVATRAPSIDEYCSVAESRPEASECFPLLIAIHNRDIDMLTYFWTEHAYMWDSFHLLYLLE
jgi:hypothetical protein